MNQPIAFEDLARYVERWDRRLRATQSLYWGARGLAAGLGVAVIIAVAARIWPLLPIPWLVVLGGMWGTIGLLAAVLLVWLWPRPLLAQARYFDRRLGLQERTSTAMEIRDGGIALPQWLVQEQLEDALRSAGTVKVADAFRLHLSPRDWLLAAFLLLLLAAAIWLPNPVQDLLAERTAVRQAIEGQVETLEAIREEIAADPHLSEGERQELLEILDGTIERLDPRDLTREEALAELTEAGERLRELTDPGAESRAAGLSQAAENLGDSPITSALAEALTNEDYQLASAILEDLADEVGEQLTREQELELAEELADAAAALAASNPELAGQLAQAASAIREGDIGAARQALEQASRTTGQTGQQIAAARAANRAAQQLGVSGQQIAQAGST